MSSALLLESSDLPYRKFAYPAGNTIRRGSETLWSGTEAQLSHLSNQPHQGNRMGVQVVSNLAE